MKKKEDMMEAQQLIYESARDARGASGKGGTPGNDGG